MFETQSAGIDAVLKRPDQVLVFISYSHDDKDLADSLRDELRDINSERVLVYQDAYSIGSGERWDLSIIANLKAADWLIFLYTGRERRSYDYCGFEIGIFASAHQLDTSHKISEVARLVCLHDTSEVPAMLRMVQNRHICPYEPEGSSDFSEAEEFQFYKDSDLARFFEDLYQYPLDKPLRRGVLPRRSGTDSRLLEQPHLEAEIAGRVKRLATKFQDARKNDPKAEKFYQVRMEIDIRTPIPLAATEIPGRAVITASQDTFNLIGISPDPDRNRELKITWDQLRAGLVRNNETFAWMDKVEDDMLDAVHQRNLRSPETTFRAQDGQFYRPLLARQIIYGSGARKFSVMFVRTLPRKFAGDEFHLGSFSRLDPSLKV